MPNNFVARIRSNPKSISFSEVIAHIEDQYHYTPTLFKNGIADDCITNEAGTNEGSCKIFAFGKLAQLSAEETLACFGDYYRKDVLENPKGSDHANIRTFMRNGWDGIHFQQPALTAK